MTQVTLSQTETTTWESSGPEGDVFRREIRERIRREAASGAHVEVYSHDGVTLDAIDVEGR